MAERDAANRRRSRVAVTVFYAGVAGFCFCLVRWGADGWLWAYICFVAGWLGWMELAPESAVNRPRRRDDDPPEP